MIRPDPLRRISPRRALLALLPAVLLCAATAAPAVAQDGSFTVVNRSGRAVREFYASPAAQRNWGADRLGQDTLADGRSFAVRMPPGAGCRTNLRVLFEGGAVDEQRNLDTCANTDIVLGPPVAAAPRAQTPRTETPRPEPSRPGGPRARPGTTAPQTTGNPSFNLRNEGQRALREVYASLTSETDWGRDRLGEAVVEPGASFAVRLPAGPCRYDLRVVWADDQDEERRDVDLCSVADLRFR